MFQSLPAGFHALNYSMFELSRGILEQMKAYVELQEKEFAENVGYTYKHQREVGTGYLIVFSNSSRG